MHNDFSTLFELLPIGAYRSTADGRQLRANPALVRLDGYQTEAELLAATKDIANEWYVDPARRELFKRMLETHGQVLGMVSEVYRHKTRERIWVRVHAHVVRDSQGQVLYYEGTVEDISAEQQSRQALLASEARFRALTELSSDWYWELDTEFRFTRLILGARSVDSSVTADVIGKTRQEVGNSLLSEAQWEAHHAVLRAHQRFHNFEFQCHSGDGGLVWHSISGEPKFNEDGSFAGYQGLGRDISEQKHAAETIHHLAFHDALTGLPNRRLLLDRLQQALSASARSGQKNILLFLDLDKFKPLNDEFGHDVGDRLLRQLAQRIKHCVRSVDTVARLGGDEFVILLVDVGVDLETARVQARQVGQKILHSLALPYDLGEHIHQFNCSIGAVVLADPTQSIETYIKQADIAMYQAKAAGRNTLCFYAGG